MDSFCSGALACLLVITSPLRDGAELLYTNKDDWGGFLHTRQSHSAGELKAADLKLLKFAHNELLKEKDERFQADNQATTSS